MDGSIITDLRTGAGGAVSAKYLANEDSNAVGVLGSGNVASHGLWAVCEIMGVSAARVYSTTRSNREEFAEKMGKRLGIDVTAVSSTKDAVRDSDIVITATKADRPVLLEEHVQEGMHICALGNPPEIDPKVFLKTKVFTELLEQSAREGKLSYAIKAGVVKEDVAYPELGNVMLGREPGRTHRRDITLFDCQGLIAQDAVPAWEMYTQVARSGRGKWLDLNMGGGLPQRFGLE
jgi:ornithine cyclodeaminase/alanine dehydrogenase-like protein (mu-crystallin family)